MPLERPRQLLLDRKYLGIQKRFVREKRTSVSRDGGLQGLLLILKRKNNRVTYLLKEAQTLFLAKLIDQNADDQGKLFQAVKSLLVERKSLCFSDYQDKNKLVNELGMYFVQRIEEFVLLTEDDVRMLIANFKFTSRYLSFRIYALRLILWIVAFF